MRRRLWPLTGLVLIAAGVALLIWRWRTLHVSSVAIGTGLMVLGTVPAVLWVIPRLPPSDSARRIPRVFWIGLAMIVVGTLSTALFEIPVSETVTTMSSSPGHTLHRVASPPKMASQQLDQILPGAHIAKTFVSSGPGHLSELLIARGSHLVAAATWDGQNQTLTFNNLGWNLYMQGKPTPAPRYSWAQLRHQVEWPSNANVLGPYQLPGYDVVIVPKSGQIWYLNDMTRTVEGSGL